MRVQRNVGFAADVVNVLVDVPCIEGGIRGEAFGSAAQTCFGLCHEREKIAAIVLLKGAGLFGDDTLALLGMARRRDACAIAPQIFFGFALG